MCNLCIEKSMLCKKHVKFDAKDGKGSHTLLTCRHKLYKLYLKLQQFIHINGEKKGELTL